MGPFRAEISREQFAIGHGGFHAGRIAIRDSQGYPNLDIGYVYDCGSESADAFRRSLHEFLRQYTCPLHILFVSHVHADHINGIDRLVGYKIPDIVILPYLAPEDIAAGVIADFSRGNLSASYCDYVRDPLRWWRSRGVQTAVFLEPGGDGDESPQPPPPDHPIEGEEIPEDPTDSSLARLAAILRHPKGPLDSALTPANPAVRKLPKANILAGSGSAFRLEWKLLPSEPWRSADWFLVPYAHPVDTTTRTQFRKAVFRCLKLKRPTSRRFQQRLVESIRDVKGAEELTGIYSEYFGSSHNAVSLSLYSGPSATVADYRRPWQSWCDADLQVPCRGGWLSTGDAMLREKKRREPWRKVYRRYNGHIGVLTLPHHGSINNFHEEVVEWSGLQTVLATTIESDGRIAGLRDTLLQAEKHAWRAHIVDDTPKSAFRSSAIRDIGP